MKVTGKKHPFRGRSAIWAALAAGLSIWHQDQRPGRKVSPRRHKGFQNGIKTKIVPSCLMVMSPSFHCFDEHLAELDALRRRFQGRCAVIDHSEVARSSPLVCCCMRSRDSLLCFRVSLHRAPHLTEKGSEPTMRNPPSGNSLCRYSPTKEIYG